MPQESRGANAYDVFAEPTLREPPATIIPDEIPHGIAPSSTSREPLVSSQRATMLSTDTCEPSLQLAEMEDRETLVGERVERLTFLLVAALSFLLGVAVTCALS